MQIIKSALKSMGLIDKLECESFLLERQPLTKDFQKSYLEKVEQLKAWGLKEAIAKNGGVIPFPKLSESEQRIWSCYCPTKKDLDKYTDIIPSDVLDLIVETKHLFGNIQIWSEAKETIDPIVIGEIKTGEYSWNKDLYLLARWGESLKPFHTITKIVIKKVITNRKLAMEKIQRELKTGLEDNELVVRKYFEGEGGSDNILTPSSYGITQ